MESVTLNTAFILPNSVVQRKRSWFLLVLNVEIRSSEKIQGL